jgi:hypothetical protein
MKLSVNGLIEALSPSTARREVSLSRRARQLASMVVLSALAVAGFAVAAPEASASPPGYNVFVGYADNARSNAANFPTPFDTGNGVVNEGAPSTAELDGGAIRITNPQPNTSDLDPR